MIVILNRQFQYIAILFMITKKSGVRSSFNTMAVWEQHPRSNHKGATNVPTHPAVRVGFELATDRDGIPSQFYVFAN